VKEEELFDLVDELDRPVGRAPRREVHARGLRHRAIHVLIFDRGGRVFLQKRSAGKDMSPLAWDSSCSGHVDAGEEYDEACVRELSEELGLSGVAPERWFRVEACPQTGNEFVWVYRLEHGGPFVLQPEEIDEGRFYTREELSAALLASPARFAPAFRYLWPLAKRMAGNSGYGINKSKGGSST
jgi:isopentenyl-diphosphate delta-isomerase